MFSYSCLVECFCLLIFVEGEGKVFVRQVWHVKDNALDRILTKVPLLVGPFCCIIFKRAAKNLVHIL